MGAKEYAEALPDLQRMRSKAAIRALLEEDNAHSPMAALAAALDQLAGGVRDEAALIEQHKPKGWQSARGVLLATAGKLNDLAREIDKLEEQPVTPGQRDPKRGIEPGGDPDQPGVAPRNPEGFVYREPTGNDAGEPDPAAVDAHLERLANEARDAQLDEPAADETGGIPLLTTQQRIEAGLPVAPSEETMAYLRGDGATPLLDTVHQEARDMLEDRRQQAADDDPFTDPAAPVSLAPPLTFAGLMQPIHNAELTHWSHSQLSTLDDCGVKYAAQRVLEKPQVPQWSLVGGKAFHAAVDVIECRILAPGSTPENWGTPAAIWATAFGEAITEQATTAPVPPAQWRAANKGAEGFDWWRVEGERMVELYVKTRTQGIEAAAKAGVPPRQILQVVDLPILEAELKIDVPGPMGAVPFVSVLDQAWAVYGASGVLDSVLIVDIKTGARTPTDTFQLGSQAMVLAQHMGLDLATARDLIKACYYDARKGLFTEAFKPLERHPFDELVYRVHTAEWQRQQGIYRPHVGPFCNGCAVKYACPLMQSAS